MNTRFFILVIWTIVVGFASFGVGHLNGKSERADLNTQLAHYKTLLDQTRDQQAKDCQEFYERQLHDQKRQLRPLDNEGVDNAVPKN